MSRIFLGLLGVVFSFFLLKYRERVGDIIGEPDWAVKIGGVYNLIIICGVIGFFWSVAYITGTEQILFAPLLWMFPHHGPGPTGIPGSEF